MSTRSGDAEVDLAVKPVLVVNGVYGTVSGADRALSWRHFAGEPRLSRCGRRKTNLIAHDLGADGDVQRSSGCSISPHRHCAHIVSR